MNRKSKVEISLYRVVPLNRAAAIAAKKIGGNSAKTELAERRIYITVEVNEGPAIRARHGTEVRRK